MFLVDDREDLDAILAADAYYTAPGVTVAGIHGVEPGHPARGTQRSVTASEVGPLDR